MLRDPNGNEIEVQVERRTKKLCFKNGWYGLKDFYDINLGGWVVFTYDSPGLMFLTIYNKMDVEIAYPKFNHPIIARLNHNLCERGSVDLCKEETMTLTASAVHCGYLVYPDTLNRACYSINDHYSHVANCNFVVQVVPWIGFFEEILPHYEIDITDLDCLEFYWRCITKFEQRDNTLVCMIGGEWETICRARNLAVEQTIKLDVAHESNKYVINLRFVAGQYKQREILTLMTRVISKKTGEELYCIKG
jgi:hypothetical protein